MVRTAKNSVRYCHSDHLLHATGSSEGESLQPDSGYAPEAIAANNESINEDVGVVDPSTNISESLRRSSRSTQPPKRLIEEMEQH